MEDTWLFRLEPFLCVSCKFRFSCEFYEFIAEYYYYCDICGGAIFPSYVYIIKKFKDSGFLPENYKLKCCDCYYTKKD